MKIAAAAVVVAVVVVVVVGRVADDPVVVAGIVVRPAAGAADGESLGRAPRGDPARPDRLRRDQTPRRWLRTPHDDADRVRSPDDARRRHAVSPR